MEVLYFAFMVVQFKIKLFSTGNSHISLTIDTRFFNKMMGDLLHAILNRGSYYWEHTGVFAEKNITTMFLNESNVVPNAIHICSHYVPNIHYLQECLSNPLYV